MMKFCAEEVKTSKTGKIGGKNTKRLSTVKKHTNTGCIESSTFSCGCGRCSHETQKYIIYQSAGCHF